MNAGGSSSVWPALRLARPGTSPTPWACTATCAPPCRPCTRRRAWTRSSGGWRCAPPSSRRSEVFTSDPLGIDGRTAVELAQELREEFPDLLVESKPRERGTRLTIRSHSGSRLDVDVVYP